MSSEFETVIVFGFISVIKKIRYIHIILSHSNCFPISPYVLDHLNYIEGVNCDIITKMFDHKRYIR